MIPNNKLSLQPVEGNYNAPDNLYTSLTEDYELGGKAIQDTSEGLDFQIWKGSVIGNVVVLEPQTQGDAVSIFTESNIREFRFTFDQNMRWVAATITADKMAHLHWYDSSVEKYIVTDYPGVTSIHLSIDDKLDLDVQIGQSDVIFTYLKGDTLYNRSQRNRFLVEYKLYQLPRYDCMITNFGMTDKRRVQFDIKQRTTKDEQWILK